MTLYDDARSLEKSFLKFMRHELLDEMLLCRAPLPASPVVRIHYIPRVSTCHPISWGAHHPHPIFVSSFPAATVYVCHIFQSGSIARARAQLDLETMPANGGSSVSYAQPCEVVAGGRRTSSDGRDQPNPGGQRWWGRRSSPSVPLHDSQCQARLHGG